MSMMSFVFIGIVAVDLLIMAGLEHFVKNKLTVVCAEKWVLLVSSYVFIAYADWRFLIVMVAMTVSTWFFGSSFFAGREKLRWGGIVVPILALCFFKYTNFFIDSFASKIGSDHVALKLILPLGISFYSFSAISYVVDVGRHKIESMGLLDVAVYLSFYPKLTSGPIQRSGEFFEQLNSSKKASLAGLSEGAQIFAIGLFKKLVIADRLSVFVNQVYATPKAFGSLTVLLAVFAYSLQILFDFSGYSDMAIGSARILGFHLPRNFNLPYLAQNVTEFWKRWHITLSSWLQDYLYIPLGGNRKGKARAYLNLFLTMVIGGLWHGANWTYVIWGALHGLGLIIHKLWSNFTKSLTRKSGTFARAVSTVLTFIFVSFCWIFFRADSLSHAFEIISRVFAFSEGLQQPYLWFFFAVAVLVVVSLVSLHVSKKNGLKTRRDSQGNKLNVCYVESKYPLQNLRTFWGLVIFFVFVGITICLAYTGGSPFIYGMY